MKKYFLGLFLVLLLLSTTGCGKKVVGRWKAVDSKTEYYYIFNRDGTCSYEMTVARLDCTYQIDGNNLIILYKGNPNHVTYEYSIKKDTLIIKDSAGNDNIFAKEK